MWARRAWRRGCSSASPLTHADRLLLPSLEPNGWVGMAEQRKLLSDLAGRFLHACMAKFSRSLLQSYPHVTISPLASTIQYLYWYETRSTLAKLQAFLLLNKMRPQPIFPPPDLEALIVAYMMQEPSTTHSDVKGSMLTMAIGVSRASGTVDMDMDMDTDTDTDTDTDPFYFKGLVFTEHHPFSLNKKLLLALFRILFRREVEDVLAQHQQGCLDPLCTISMRPIGTCALPPLLKLYVDQSFGCSHKTRKRAAEGLKNLLKLHNEGHL